MRTGGRPTQLQENVMKIHKEDLKNGITRSWGVKMREGGYSPTSAINPGKALLTKQGWQDLLDEIDDKPLMRRLKKLSNSKNESIALKAIKELLVLKERYPKEKKSVKGAWVERKGLIMGD